MTHVHDDPESFAHMVLESFCEFYPGHVCHVPDGALRVTATPEGKVAVVIDGGSDHYPAFAGYVGPGGADACVADNVFASPSTQSIARIGRLADRDGGVIFGYGNDAGDVLNFGAAAERLTDDGIPACTLVVTDDMASASAEAGYDLDEVTRLATHANRRTVSFGVAFGGCTLPGAKEPLFEVPKGRLSIHGKLGLDETNTIPAAGQLCR